MSAPSKPSPPVFQITGSLALGTILACAQFVAARDAVPPTQFELLIPANNAIVYATNQGDKPRLAWQESSDSGPGIDHYEVWLDGENVDRIPAGVHGHLPGEKDGNYEPFRPYGFLAAEKICYYTPPVSKLAAGPHQWHVEAVDRDGNKRRSENRFSFKVEAPGPPKVFVNHLGYLSGGNIRFVVDGSVGAPSFDVVDLEGKVVLSGDLKSDGGAFGKYMFGDFTGPGVAGTYRIRAGAEYSMWFPIGLEAKLNYEDLLRKYRDEATLEPRSDGMMVQGIGGGSKDIPYMRQGHWRWCEMELHLTAWFAEAVFELLPPANPSPTPANRPVPEP